MKRRTSIPTLSGGTIVPHPKCTVGELLETCKAVGVVLVADRKAGYIAKPMPAGWRR